MRQKTTKKHSALKSKKHAARSERPTTEASAKPSPFLADPRLPAVGTKIDRAYKGRIFSVKVCEDGLEYGGSKFRSLSAIARKILIDGGAPATTQCNGYLWFNLLTKDARATKADAKKSAKAKGPKLCGAGNDIGTGEGQRAALAAAGISKRRAPKDPKDDAPRSKEGK